MTEKKQIPLVRPTLAPWEEVAPLFQEVWASGQITSGEHTRIFELAVAKKLGVDHVVAVSSCTSGLMLVLRAMDITGEVILPSFTWTSTGHALIWNDITPVFADCLPDTFTLDPEDVKKRLTEKTQAIFASNVFGVQPDMDELGMIAKDAGIPLFCDSAQAMGATYKGLQAGSTSLAEVFSLSPTKVVTAVEGGLVATSDDDLADRLRRMRDYGKSPDGLDVELFGLSARISELHSIVGAANLKRCDELIAFRKKIAERYQSLLTGIGDISFQKVPSDRESSFNYFVILTDRRDELHAYLDQNSIQSKRYFFPPVHLQTSYRCLDLPTVSLPVTEHVSARALALPFYSHMADEDVETVAMAVRKVFE